MKVSDILKKDTVTISCELFPPKQGTQLENYKKIVAEMAALKPAYISCTYGATGGTSDYTVEIADAINANHIPAIAHLTCASSTKEKVRSVITELKERKIENILALRGDIPEQADFPLPDQYHHAYELIEEIKSMGDFCIGGACYPEGHPESSNRDTDIENLKHKVEAGVDFLTTQMIFDNDMLYSFLYRLQSAGIHVPVLAGIMPITNANQVSKMVDLSNAYIPRKLLSFCDRFRHDSEAMKQAGIAYATDQIIDLISNGIRGIHIYTMNKPEIAESIVKNVDSIIKAVNK